MNIFRNPKHLPTVTVLSGIIGMVLRWAFYAAALDEKGLLTSMHPLGIALTAFSLLILALIAVSVWKLDGSEKYEDNFAPSIAAFTGHILAALGILLTVLLNPPRMYGNLGTAWNILGIAAPVCLIIAGSCRKKGKKPFFLLHLIPCLFLVFHIVNHYQTWSGNPQLQDDIYAVFSTTTLMFFAFYSAAFDADTGHRRMHLFMGLAAVYLTLVSLTNTEYLYLYMGCACWALSDLCSLIPVPKPPEPEKNETEGGESQ